MDLIFLAAAVLMLVAVVGMVIGCDLLAARK